MFVAGVIILLCLMAAQAGAEVVISDSFDKVCPTAGVLGCEGERVSEPEP